MKEKIKYIICTVIILSVLLTPISAFAAGQDGISTGNISLGGSEPTTIAQNVPIIDTVPKASVVYTPVQLTDRTTNFFATISGDITVTLLSSERDYIDGHYLEYYSGFSAKDKNCYFTVLNTLKTMTELNTHFKLNFVDPFSESISNLLTTYESSKPAYGDLLISAVINFDGIPRIRTAVISAADIFKTEKKTVTDVVIEKKLVTKLKSLLNFRDINLGFIYDIAAAGTADNLAAYLKESDYRFDSLSLQNERLNGYDMLLICAPVRDLTLEEIVILDNFLKDGNNKSFMYFAPKVYRNLPNLTAFLKKWGIETDTAYMLSTVKKDCYFGENTQLYGKVAKSSFGEKNAAYIMNYCTPMTLNNSIDGVKVSPLIVTKTDSAEVISRDDAPLNLDFSCGNFSNTRFPLVALSQKTAKNKTVSSVVAFSSVDFITTYFSYQNKKNDGYLGNYCGNLEITTELLDDINRRHRDEPSGLTKYAVSLSDRAIDKTSGYTKTYIESFAIIAVAGTLVLLIAALMIFGKRKQYARTKR